MSILDLETGGDTSKKEEKTQKPESENKNTNEITFDNVIEKFKKDFGLLSSVGVLEGLKTNLNSKNLEQVKSLLLKIYNSNDYSQIQSYLSELTEIEKKHLEEKRNTEEETSNQTSKMKKEEQHKENEKGNITFDYLIDKFKKDFGLVSSISKFEGLKKVLESKKLPEINDLLSKINDSKDYNQIFNYINELTIIAERIENEKKLAEKIKNEKEKNKFYEKIGKINDIKLRGECEGGDWDGFYGEIKDKLKDDLGIKDKQEMQQLLSEIETKYRPFYESLNGKLDLSKIGGVLDDMTNQVKNLGSEKTGEIKIKLNRATDIGQTKDTIIGLLAKGNEKLVDYTGDSSMSYFSEPLKISETEVVFSSKEQALTIIESIKNGLKDMESINLDDIMYGFLIGALKTTGNGLLTIDEMILKGIKWDIENSFGNGLTVGVLSTSLQIILAYKAIRFYKSASSGIDNNKYTELVNGIQENIEIYKEAGINDISHLENLKKKIESYSPQSEGQSIDPAKRANNIYGDLQSFRGTFYGDGIRFTAASIGNYFDGQLWPEGDLNGGKLRKTLNFALRLQMIPIKIGMMSINKGVNGKLLGWGIKSKSEVILEYIDAFKRINLKFKGVFSIIDKLEKFSDSEKKAIKKRVLDEYSGNAPLSKLDSLKRYKLNFGLLTHGERQTIYNNLKEDLIKQGETNVEINSMGDFLKNVFKLKGERVKTYNTFLKSLNPIENIDRITSEILQEEISKKFGNTYVPELRKTIDLLNNNASEFEKSRENINKEAEKFMHFVKYYPDISDSLEVKLIERIKQEAIISPSQDSFNESIIDQLNKNNLKVNKQNILDFLQEIKKGNPVDVLNMSNTHQSKVIETLNIIKEKLSLSELEYNNRKEAIKNFYSSEKFLWGPHYIEVLNRLLDGKDINDIKYENLKVSEKDFNTFINKKANKDTSLETLESKQENFDDIKEKIKDKTLDKKIDYLIREYGELSKIPVNIIESDTQIIDYVTDMARLRVIVERMFNEKEVSKLNTTLKLRIIDLNKKQGEAKDVAKSEIMHEIEKARKIK